MANDLPELSLLQNLNIENHTEIKSNPNRSNCGKAMRRRKSQSEEDFMQQKEAFKQGPPVQNSDWFDLFDLSQFEDASIKMDRERVLHAAERAYYLRNYQKSLEILNITDKWKMKDKQKREITAMRSAILAKLNQS